MVRSGDTMVLVTVVAAQEEKPDIDFLPLQVEYREKTAAAGKIPGGFMKREGRPTDKEVLSARLIDRPIRPMIPKGWRYETQIVATVYSAEPNFDPDTLGAVGASAALLISDIPFSGPIAEVRVGRIEGEFVVNPTSDELKESDMDISVAGSDAAITMVEGEMDEISETDFLAALEFAHEKIRELNGLQNQLAGLITQEKREITLDEAPEEFTEAIKNEIYKELVEYVHKITSKQERSETRAAIKEKALAKAEEVFGENEELAEKIHKYTSKIISDLEKNEMRKMILDDGIRLDGRKVADIRPISCEIGTLPRTHGSSLFTRGETQALCTVTLGTSRDEQMIDGLQPLYNERFMLHYNFPPFSVGEVGRMGVSRREVGHGHLAWRSLKGMLPNQADFPYTLRIVSDILESNGSSSMATVCGGSLSLFDAGVPMKKAVAGIAMGLILDEEKFAVLSDILGDEDFLGDMDFKVAGTVDGITACQMDIKVEGLSMEILEKALKQANEGRMHILGIMNEVIAEPKDDISEFAPRFMSFKVPVDTIGAVIGSGGETIRELCKEYEVEINIEDDGTVLIASADKEKSDGARRAIEQIIAKPEEGEVYQGKVAEVRDGLGAIIEFMPKTKGLLHISQIAHERVEDVAEYFKVGDKVEVKLLEITRDGKYRLSRKILLPRPEGMPEQNESNKPRQDRGDRRGIGSRRDERRGGNRR